MKKNSIDELVRDATMSIPMSKSEMRYRIEQLVKKESSEYIKRNFGDVIKKLSKE